MSKLFNLLAMGTPPGTEANPTGQMLQMVLMFGAMGVMFYFLLIRPQSKQRKEHERLLANVKTGDKILTSGGVYGIVANVKDKTLMVKIADNVKVEVVKTAVTSVIQKSAETENSTS